MQWLYLSLMVSKDNGNILNSLYISRDSKIWITFHKTQKNVQANNWSLTYITMVFKTSTHIFVDNGTKFRRSLRVFGSNMLLLLLWWSRSCQNSMFISTTNNGVSCLRWIRTTCCISTMTRNEWNLCEIKILYQKIKKQISHVL